MEIEKLINKITEKKKITESEELYDWVSESEDKEKEFVRYKNLWALLQSGKEMKEESISRAYQNVLRKANSSASSIIKSVFKYAAIALIAITTGFFMNGIFEKEEAAINEVAVPKGNRTSVILPDSSKVWLTNGTTLNYPNKFDSKSREVELSGEAYFEVTHNENQPFNVNIGNNRIRVLGTKFAVLAYPDDNIVQTDLISGKVVLDIKIANSSKSYMVKRSHSLVYDKATGKLSEKIIPVGFYNYWQNGSYEFVDERFEDLAKKVERIYNVKIIFENPDLKEIEFTGTLNIDDNIYTLMEVAKKASGKPFEYTIERNNIYIKNKKTYKN